jgi:HK97 family phage major capsid protein
MPRGRRSPGLADLPDPTTASYRSTDHDDDRPGRWEVGDLRGRTPAELQRLAEQAEARMAELHQTPAGELRTLTRSEQAEFDAASAYRQAARERVGEHDAILRAFARNPGSAQVALEYLGGASGRAEWSDPLSARAVGPEVSMVDLLARSGRTVNDDEWRLGMLGALASGQRHHVARFARYSDGTVLPNGTRVNADEMRDLLISSSAGTATLTPDVVAAMLIDRMRAAAVVQRLGARTVPMRSDTTKVPRLTGDPTVSWLAEGATVTGTDATLDSVDLVARRLTGLCKASQELFEDSDPVSIGQVLRDSFGGALATVLDRVALKGSGTAPEPRGIRNQTGVSVNVTAAAASWAVVAERVGVLVGANVPVDRIGVAVNPTSWTTIMSQAEAGGQPIARPPFLADVQVLPTGNLALPATGELYAGDYSELVIGVRIGLDFAVLRERYLDEGKIGFLPRVRADVGVMHGASFAVRTALSS